MKIHRRRLLAIAVVLVSPLFSGRAVYAAHPTVRWDIVSVQPPDVSAGGHASARTNNDFKITLTGSGTFRIKPGNPQATGGGTFEIRDQAEQLVNAGTYEVTGVVRFEVAPGELNPLLIDHIGNPAEAQAGLVVLNIAYSDGAEGILVVSCHLTETPDQVFEGITVSHRFVDFWNREAPSDDPLIDANRTLFHVSP